MPTLRPVAGVSTAEVAVIVAPAGADAARGSVVSGPEPETDCLRLSVESDDGEA